MRWMKLKKENYRYYVESPHPMQEMATNMKSHHQPKSFRFRNKCICNSFITIYRYIHYSDDTYNWSCMRLPDALDNVVDKVRTTNNVMESTKATRALCANKTSITS